MSKIWLGVLLFMMPLMSDIDELIESMQSVSDEERFELMNQFKAEVIQLQEKERMEAMMKVISITESTHGDKVLQDAKDSSTKKIDNIDHVIETHDRVSVQEHIGSEIENSSNDVHELNEIDEIEPDEVEDDD